MINMGEKDKEITVSKPGPISKIEKAGENVIEHLIELARTTDLTHAGMAKRINEVYGLDLKRQNVEVFFKVTAKKTQEYLERRKELAELRVKLSLDHREKLVMHARKLDKMIERVDGEDGDLMELDKRANALANLVDKAGKLLLREARLSGKINERGATNIDKMQVNIVQVSEERSEIIRRLKKFDPEKVVDTEVKDVTPNENKKPDN